jgi:hypothetical protein
MRYVIVDQEGASRGHFEVFADVLRAIDDSRDDEAMIRELCVLEYDDRGKRVGTAIDAASLVPRAAEELASVSQSSGVAETYSDWHMEKQSRGGLQAV